jgi:glycosyltransferase involved in cell wall biosynthesis
MIALITSLYKSEKYLPTFLKHIKKVHEELNALKISFEHIVIANDYSEEEEKLIKSAGIDFKVIRVPRESLYASWNRGVDEAFGEIIGFWNVDDLRYVEALKEADVRLIQKKEGDVIYFPFKYKKYITFLGMRVPITVTFKAPEFDKKIFATQMRCGPFFMFTKSFFNKVGPFDESFKIAGDFEWCSRASRSGIFVQGKSVGGVFVSEGKGLSTSGSTLQKEENDRILNSAL